MPMTIRAVRRAKEITKKEMAEACGVHENTYSMWEQAPEKISLKNAQIIAEKLDVSMDDLIFLTQ